MLIHGTIPPLIPPNPTAYTANKGGVGGVSISCTMKPEPLSPGPMINLRITAAAVAATAVISLTAAVNAMDMGAQQQQKQDDSTLENVPQMLSGQCGDLGPEDCKKARIQRPKSKQAEVCTVKCLNTCIRGGLGSPGEGPLNIRGPIVVFKQGFRSRQYCLVECSDICNLIKDGEDGP